MARLSLRSFCIGLTFAGFPLTVAGAPTQPGELQFPLESNIGCLTCHAFPNIAPHTEDTQYNPWAVTGTLMGNSARDPVFWAAIAIAEQDGPEFTEDCIRCHSPRAFLNGNGDAISMDELTVNEREGIGCDFCHRGVWDGVTPAGNAQYEIDDFAPDGLAVPKRGPWTYEEGDHMAHTFIQDVSFLGDSRFCGTCHDVTTHRERVDDAGVGMGFDFNEQRTYSEWLNSDFAIEGNESEASCQDCHMPAIADAAGCSDFNSPEKRHATGARKHNLVGANRFMLELLQEEYGSTAPDDVYQNAIVNLDAFLPTSATLEVTFPDQVDLSAGIESIATTVTNNTGHKLPSGYSEGRVMWLEVIASYDGEVVYSSGAWQQDTLDIQDDEQVRRYEGVAEDAGDGTTLHLLRNNRWRSDTRIPPKGLVEDVQTDPVNTDWYALTDGKWQHWDEASYSFPAAEVVEHEDAAAELDISVRLLYVINTNEYISTLADDNVINDAGEEIAARFAELGHAPPLVLAESTSTVPLTGLLPIPASDETGTEEESGEAETNAESESSETNATATDTDPGGADDGGSCACNTDREGPDGVAFLGLFGLLAWRRRRS